MSELSKEKNQPNPVEPTEQMEATSDNSLVSLSDSSFFPLSESSERQSEQREDGEPTERIELASGNSLVNLSDLSFFPLAESPEQQAGGPASCCDKGYSIKPSTIDIEQCRFGEKEMIGSGVDGKVFRQAVEIDGERSTIAVKHFRGFLIPLPQPLSAMKSLSILKKLKEAGVDVVDFHPKLKKFQLVMEDLSEGNDPNIEVMQLRGSFTGAGLTPAQLSQIGRDVGKNLALFHKANFIGRTVTLSGDATRDLFLIVRDKESQSVRVVVADVGGVGRADNPLHLKRWLDGSMKTWKVRDLCNTMSQMADGRRKFHEEVLDEYFRTNPDPELFENVRQDYVIKRDISEDTLERIGNRIRQKS